MSNSTEQTEIRETGITALRTVLKQEKNISIIENYIHINSKKSNEYKKTYKRILYQTVGDVINCVNLKLLVNNIKQKTTGWNHPIFTNIRHRIEEHDDFIINPFEVVEGVTNCHCGSKRVFTYQAQVRSCDEPMTTFAKCVACKKQWSYSG